MIHKGPRWIVIWHRWIYPIEVDLTKDEVANIIHIFTTQVAPEKSCVGIMPFKVMPVLPRCPCSVEEVQLGEASGSPVNVVAICGMIGMNTWIATRKAPKFLQPPFNHLAHRVMIADIMQRNFESMAL